MRFHELLLKNLIRRKLRSLLTISGVAVAIATVVTLVGVSSGLKKSATEAFQSHGVDLVVVRAGTVQRVASSMNEDLAARLAAMAGVADVVPSLTDVVSISGEGLVGVPVHGWPPDSHVWDTLHVADGRRLRSDDRGDVVLGSLLAHNLEKSLGDEVEIEQQNFKVVGIYESSSVYESGAAVVPLADLQELMDRAGQVSEFMLMLDANLANRKATLENLKSQIAKLRDDRGKPLGLSAMETEDYVSHDLEIQLAGDMAWATSLIALSIGSVGVLNTMLMSVLERTQEIGVLRAIGWPKLRIIEMIVGESCVLSVAGACLGMLAAVTLTAALSRLPAASGLIRGDTSLGVLAAGLAVAGLMGLVGSLYPALRGAGLRPTEALHYE
ncbi:MAG TPA: ABC transporter permease [Pirellulales bacterium]|nr:ABC transporter permease [Pirellulales bacterium]